MLNRIKKYFSRDKNNAKPKDDSDVSDFLTFLIESPEAIAYQDELLPRIESFKSRSRSRQEEELPGLYLYVEKYIFKSSTPDLNRFRKLVGKHFKTFIDGHPDFQLIFLSYDQQVNDLCHLFLLRVCKRLEQFLGNSPDTSWGALSRWLIQQDDNHGSEYRAELTFTQVFVRGYATQNDYIALSHDFFSDLEKRFNVNFILSHYNEAYEDLATKFTNLDAFHELIKLFPNKTLDEGKLNILSIQQIKELLLEKVQNLEKISSELLQKNDTLNKQSELLNLQNKQLQDAQRTIELKNKELSDYTLNLEGIVDKRTRELETTNEILKQYTKNLEEHTFAISHQLKAPVSRIMGLMNLLNHEQEIQSGNIMQLMQESVHELNDVLADLVHALNIKKDASHIVLESCDLGAIVKSIVDEFMKVYKVQAKFSVTVDGLSTFTTDRNYVTEALKHILDNCFKFRNPDHELVIGTEIVSRYNFTQVVISDNGIGFPLQQVREKLFNPFQKFNTHVSGKGLGLYFTNQLVSVLNGSVEFESSMGEGTKVTFTLPTVE